MASSFSSQQRSANMAAIHGKDAKPEGQQSKTEQGARFESST